jgi:hypothetical protein
MFTTDFRDVYSKNNYRIDEHSLDLQFLRDVGAGNMTAEKYFNETTSYRQRVFLDSPTGRFEGVNAINEFAKSFVKEFGAIKAEIYPVIQTIAAGRICTEMEIWFYQTDGQINKVPTTVFSDLIGMDKLEGMRIYFFYQYLKGSVAYRRPIYRPRDTKPATPWLMTGVVRFYYEQLHNWRTEEAIANIVEMCTDDVMYGGYHPVEIEPVLIGKEKIREEYSKTCINVPANNYVRFETFCDDGITCCVEWSIIPRKPAIAKGFYCFAGCAMYERAKDGKLFSIRINDNAGFPPGIDLNSIPQSDWYIDD